MALIKSIKFCYPGERAVEIPPFYFELTTQDSYLFDTYDYKGPGSGKRGIEELVEAVEKFFGDKLQYELVVNETLRLNQFTWKLQDRSPEFPTKENSENHEQIVL